MGKIHKFDSHQSDNRVTNDRNHEETYENHGNINHENQENYRNQDMHRNHDDPRAWERRRREEEERMRYRSRSRDRYDEHRERDREYRERREFDYDYRRRSPDHRRSPDRDYRRDRHWEGDSYGGARHNSNYDERREREYRSRSPKDIDRDWVPGPTLMIKGILPETNEDMIQHQLKAYSPLSIRLIRNKAMPRSKGYCFVDFLSADHAKVVMQTFRSSEERGYPLEIDGSVCTIEFAESSRARQYQGTSSRRDYTSYESDSNYDYDKLPSGMAAYSAASSSQAHRMDWICSQCSAQNFARRAVCFRCQSPRSADCQLLDPLTPLDAEGNPMPTAALGSLAQGQAQEHPPSDTLILRGLAHTSAEASVHQALRIFASTIQDVRLIRNRDHSSRGFCFVEFTSIEASSHALTMCLSEGLIVDGQQVTVAYASGASQYHKSGTRSQSGHANERSQQSLRESHGPDEDKTQDTDGGYDPSFDEPGFNNATLEDQKKQRAEVQAKSLAAAAAVLKKKKSPFPPVFEEAGAAYVFDASSGYFYEAASGWYYEPKTKLYYGIPASGGTEQKWHVYKKDEDPPFQVYEPQAAQPTEAATAAGSDQATAAATAAAPAPASTPASAPASAPTQNSTTTTPTQGTHGIKINVSSQAAAASTTPVPAPTPTAPPTQTLADQPPPKKKKKKIDLATWEAKKKKQEEAMRAPVITLKMTHTLKPMAAPTPAPAPTPAAPAPAESTKPTEPAIAPAPAKKPKIASACLLCKRGFPTVEKLKLHEEKSKLHQQNLEKAKKEGKPIPKSVVEQQEEHKKAAAVASQHKEEVREVESRRESEPRAQKESFMIADAPAPSFSLGSKKGENATVEEVLKMEVTPQYKDRAALRRDTGRVQAYHPPPDNAAPEPYIPPPTPEEAAMFLQPEGSYQATTAVPIHHQQANVGASMMNRMGWQDGQGLGREGRGMVNPVQADNSFEGKMGIGVQQQKGLNYTVNPEDSYKDTIHKMSQARFEAADANLAWNQKR